jgi:hypothetical protein
MLSFVLVASASAAPVFFEGWDSGTIDTTMWTRLTNAGGTDPAPPDTTNIVAIENVDGAGDYGVFTAAATSNPGGGGHHINTLCTVNALADRSLRPRCSFLSWGDPSDTSNWAGAAFPGNNGVNGPFRSSGTSGFSYQSHESTFAAWHGLTYKLDRNGEWNAGPATGTAYEAAYSGAVSKALAVMHRVEQDPAGGSLYEWSSDFGATWTTALDERGTGPDTLANSWIGFGSFVSKSFVDSILCEDNNNIVPVELSVFSAE